VWGTPVEKNIDNIKQMMNLDNKKGYTVVETFLS
jgi:hypothetical protein